MNTREICLKIIENLFEGKSFESIIMNCRSFKNLTNHDKSFVRMIILTYLRRNGEIEKIIDKFVKIPLTKKKSKLKNILRIGITQILFLNVSDHASVFTAVELAKKFFYGMHQFVNAVMRNISREKVNILKETNSISNIPNWIKSELELQFSKKEIKELSSVITQVPCLDIHYKNKGDITENWISNLKGFKLCNKIVRVKNSGLIETVKGFKNGNWWIQSVASSIPCLIIENYFKEDRQSIKVLEVGSAPGGKTIQLCNAGFSVTGVEKSKDRVIKLKENLRRMKFNPNVICKDILNYNSNIKYDCALIDAPCSASGIIQKKPEILIKEKNISNLLIQQKKILQKVSSLIKDNGIIVYAVCSFITHEGENQIENFLNKNKNYCKIDLSSINIQIDCRFKNGNIKTSPLNYLKYGGTDGFFISCLKKKV